MKPATCTHLLLWGGVAVATTAAVLMGCFTPIFNSVVDKMLIISEDSATYDAFITPPVPVYTKFYLFHVTNPDEVLSFGEKPVLEERGPYVYLEHREKGDISFASDEPSVNFINTIGYEFMPEMSEGNTEDDELTNINLVMIMLAFLGKDVDQLRILWPQLEKEMQVYETHTVSEWLFKGWELPYLDLDFANSNLPPIPDLGPINGSVINGIIDMTDGFSGTIPELMVKLGMDPPESLVENRFGYYSTMNYTNDGVYKVNTGKEDTKQLLNIMEWEGKDKLSFWNDTYCDMMNGTDGTQFPPRTVKRDEPVRMFVTQLCRSLYLEFEKEIPDLGMEVLRFLAPPEMLESGNTNPDNECYCASMGCLGDSMLELSPCMPPGLPIIMSTPHFYNGDVEEQNKYVGIEPNETLHVTYLDIQPTLGVPVRAHKRIQLNLPLRQYAAFTSFYNLQELYHPVLWADETADLEQGDIDDMAAILTKPYVIAYSVGGVVAGVGTLMAVVGAVRWRRAGAVV